MLDGIQVRVYLYPMTLSTPQPAPASPTPDAAPSFAELAALGNRLRQGVVDPAPFTLFRVRYYDAKLSKKGRGVQVRTFTDRAEAEAFAASNRIYSGPCRVEVAS